MLRIFSLILAVFLLMQTRTGMAQADSPDYYTTVIEDAPAVAPVQGETLFENGMAAYVAGDYPAAQCLWRPLAEQGKVDAQYGMGLLYNNAKGVSRDDVRAAEWYRQAANQGYVKAQFNLGVLFSSGGAGVPRDDAEAVKWYRLAAEQGDAKAQYNLGLSYLKGKGVPRDGEKAAEWLQRAAAQGHVNAFHSLTILMDSLQNSPQHVK